VRIDVFTLFPAIVEGPLGESLLGRAIASGLVEVRVHDLRDWSTDRHRTVDDEAFGGGPGMVLKAEPVFAAVESLDPDRGRVLLMSPAGCRLDQALVGELAAEPHLTLVCGRYEGVDERIVAAVDEEISIGDYVLSGGELAAMVLLDAVIRLLPGVAGNEVSLEDESFASGLLEYPHYTRPREWEGRAIPDVLLSGDHKAIETWRREQAEAVTAARRPDLYQRHRKDKP
jgi:tRNA (guanine37-N1)-methyltransferase